MQRAGHGGTVLLNGVDIVDLKAKAGKAGKNKVSFEAETSSSTKVFYTFVYVCVCVCERERACVCIIHSGTQQKSVLESGNWRKLAIWEDQRASTLVVIVLLMCFVP